MMLTKLVKVKLKITAQSAFAANSGRKVDPAICAIASLRWRCLIVQYLGATSFKKKYGKGVSTLRLIYSSLLTRCIPSQTFKEDILILDSRC